MAQNTVRRLMTPGRSSLVALSFVTVLLTGSASTWAQSSRDEPIVGTGPGVLVVMAEAEVEIEQSGEASSPTVANSQLGSEPVVTNLFATASVESICVREAITRGEDPMTFCGLTPEANAVAPAAPQLVTPGLALAALRRVALPQSRLQVQPPDGETLVNFDTNFFTEAGPFTRSVRLLGRRVELQIWPSNFVWQFGDGSLMETTTPGAPYPALEVTHAYRRAGEVRAAVDTTYSANFRVDGGTWRTVPGTVTMSGESVALRVLTARPTLVGSQ